MKSSSQIHYKEQIPDHSFLLLPSRLGMVEINELKQLFAQRQILWICEKETSEQLEPAIAQHLSASNTLIFSLGNEQEEYDTACDLYEKVQQGITLIYCTGNAKTNIGSHFHITGKVLNFLTSIKLPTLPLAVTIPQETGLEFDAEALPQSIMAFGSLLIEEQEKTEEQEEKITTSRWQEQILNLNEASFASRKLLDTSLQWALLSGLKRFGASRFVFDGAQDEKMSFDKILGCALALSKEIKASTNKERVGIILPPSRGAMIANLAVLFAGKVPVNLNFTASRNAVKSAMKQADLDKYITVKAFRDKFRAFPWPSRAKTLHLDMVMRGLTSSIRKWVILSKLLPAKALAKIIGIPMQGGDKEAILLFTSGSSGVPKGVPLSHRNVLANVCQFSSRIDLPSESSVLGSLPLFHSFGCTVTLWFPIIQGINLITYINPTETRRIAELVETHQIDLLLTTPTFLRSYMKRIKPEQLASLRLVVTGAEKLQASTAEAFYQKFKIAPQEGYGLTETSPATNVNLCERSDSAQGLNSSALTIFSSRSGSVGQFLQGVSVKITALDSDKPKQLNDSGLIWLKGANVFNGYLHNPELNKEVLQDGWFKTGDVGSVDEDGFLYIEGRISRFSKVGGEMIPHEGVEDALTVVMNLQEKDERCFAIIGMKDDKRGEKLILLSTVHEDPRTSDIASLRMLLLNERYSPLWTPSEIIPVIEIPILASGKLDIKECERLAEEYLFA